ncbi:MAG: aldolase/citrate lyase family protein, partial [Pseudomonadota bacterium]
MSFTIIEQATPRLHRSELAVPGSNPAMFEKAAASAADIIFLDCEDAVAPDDKEQARKNIIQGLNEIDWGTKTMMVRINGLDTHYMYRDVVDIVEACPRLDMILIPKAGTAADVYAVDMMVTQIEAAKKRTKRIGFEVLIETALGMANVEAIAQSILLMSRLQTPIVVVILGEGGSGGALALGGGDVVLALQNAIYSVI